MSEFQCKPGYCIKCCTDIEVIPVTLGDLYREWFHRQKTGERTRFYNVFRELCDDWALVPSADGSVHAIPNSRSPCANVDMENKECSVYAVSRYVGCASFPEDWLLDLGINIDFSESEKMIKELDCYKDLTLSQQRKEELLKLRSLIDRETHISTKLLLANVFPSSVVGSKPSKRVQRELVYRLRYISDNKDVLKVLRQNLMENNTLQDYEELVMTDDPGFSFCEEI